jgi:hypothetical protein
MVYKIPPDTSEKEKIVGGLLNLNQLIWIIAGALTGAVITILTFNFLGNIAFFLGFIAIALFIPFVFYKKHDLTFFNYLKLKRKHKNKNKYLSNIRKI